MERPTTFFGTGEDYFSRYPPAGTAPKRTTRTFGLYSGRESGELAIRNLRRLRSGHMSVSQCIYQQPSTALCKGGRNPAGIRPKRRRTADYPDRTAAPLVGHCLPPVRGEYLPQPGAFLCKQRGAEPLFHSCLESRSGNVFVRFSAFNQSPAFPKRER